MAECDAFGALVVGDFVADPFADRLAVQVERHIGIDEVETGFRTVRGGAGVVDAGGDATERREGFAADERAHFAQPCAARSRRAQVIGDDESGRKDRAHLPLVGEGLWRRLYLLR
jgi:hypothetical protein